MKKILFLLSALVAVSIFTGCSSDASESASIPATEITITANDGTDFGTLSKGESATKKFTVTLDGYADIKLALGMPFGFESPDFDTNAQNSFNKKTKSFGFTAVYSPLFDGSDDDNTIVVTRIGIGGFSGQIEVHAEGKNTGIKNPNDESAKTLVTLINKPDTVNLSDRDESGKTPTYTVTAKEGTACKIKVRFTSDRYEASSSSGELTGSPFTYNYKDVCFPNETDKNYVEIEVSYNGETLKNQKGERYTTKDTPIRLNFGKAKVLFITQE